jgi:predicted amidophosphoribosyltransferase
MPYCPQCHVEFQAGSTECSDCLIPLVEGTPLFCQNCKEFVRKDDTFCDNCGVIQDAIPAADRPECENHPDRTAVPCARNARRSTTAAFSVKTTTT